MHSPRKRFGQHFLHDQGVIERIIESLAPEPQQRLVEIGPGLGALTVKVLPKVGRMDVIELDRDLVPLLQKACEGLGELVVHQQDVLRFDFGRLHQEGQGPLRVFGNLPYNISTPLIFHLLDYAGQISDMLFMLQKEVGARMAAEPGSDDYGRLSIMVQYHCQVEEVFTVYPHSFKPQPRVNSSIVRLTPYQQLPLVAQNYSRFANCVKHAFGQRRKTLRNSLKPLISDASWTTMGIDPKERAENLSVADFVRLSNYSD